MHKQHLQQIIKQVEKEIPDAIKQMDPAAQAFIRSLAIQNHILNSRIEILENNNHNLLLWHHCELKTRRKDPDNKTTHHMERFIYGSKKDVEIVKLPRVV